MVAALTFPEDLGLFQGFSRESTSHWSHRNSPECRWPQTCQLIGSCDLGCLFCKNSPFLSFLDRIVDSELKHPFVDRFQAI